MNSQSDRKTELNYKLYVANLTQSGVLAPDATVLDNKFGDILVWSYNGVGEYVLTLAGNMGLSASKMWYSFAPSQDGNLEEVNAYWNDNNSISLDVFDKARGTPSDGLLFDSSFELRIYD
jgi:hypothetical protein